MKKGGKKVKQIEITRIEVTNPMIEKYLNTIKFWDEERCFLPALMSNESEKPNSFLGIFYGDQFLGASVYKINHEQSKANIQLMNGSIQHQEEIKDYFSEKAASFLMNHDGDMEITIEHFNRDGKQLVFSIAK